MDVAALRNEKDLASISIYLRQKILDVILRAGSGHLGGCLSAVELMVALYFGGILKIAPDNPRHQARDRVLVRGHLGPLRYSLFSLIGWVGDEELQTYRTFGSRLQGHESMLTVPGVDITPSGSLGMLLSFAAGSAYTLGAIPSTVYVFLGDGEEQEGNISEAARHISSMGLNKVVCIIDRNRKQLSKPTSAVDGRTDLIRLWEGYGWEVRQIQDGHSIREILQVLKASRPENRPLAIVANTVKGFGMPGCETHRSGYHTLSTCSRETVADTSAALEHELSVRGLDRAKVKNIAKAALAKLCPLPTPASSPILRFQVDIQPEGESNYDQALTSYCRQLVSLFENNREFRLYVMTADWIPEQRARACGFYHPWVKFVDVGIREQHLLSMAHGISVTDPGARVLLILGDCFLLRAGDQLHAMAQAGSRVVVVGTDSGLCEARNGPTHQSTGQPGLVLTMPGVRLLEPADVRDLYNSLNWAFSEYPGPIYIRLHSARAPDLPAQSRNLEAYTAYESTSPVRAALTGSGLAVQGMVEAARRLDARHVGVRVINVVSPKDIGKRFVDLVPDRLPLLVVYNGNPYVLEAAVARAILRFPSPRPSIVRAHGFTLGTTGCLEDLLHHFRLDASGIEHVLEELFPGFVTETLRK